ncbi:MAG: VOC family protein [Acidobacteriota bacterium]
MSDTLKVHVALNTPKLEESVAFYRAFFGIEPCKHKPGYAKFDVAEPPLNLTLNEGPVKEQGALSHLGIQVASSEAVTRAAARLKAVGLLTRTSRTPTAATRSRTRSGSKIPAVTRGRCSWSRWATRGPT